MPVSFILYSHGSLHFAFKTYTSKAEFDCGIIFQFHNKLVILKVYAKNSILTVKLNMN